MQFDETKRPKVGIACFVWRDGKFLMMRRTGAHGAGTWSPPGGHLEFNESWEECATREVLEETGMRIKNIRFLAATNDIFKSEDKHYISIWMEADWESNEPAIMEPEKMTDMIWATFTTLPGPLFDPCWANLRSAKPELFQSRPSQQR
jgi:8-oxo-dGTP diphosphatase